MKYNTEAINQMAQQLAETFKSAVITQQESEGSTPAIAQIEADMREALRQIGQQALGLFLSSMQTTPEKEIACACGGTLHYQRKREATVISVFGKTICKRAYYAGCFCKEGKAPIDEQFGLKPGAVTAGLAMLLALAGIEFSYDKSPKWLRAYLLFDISENTVRSETEQMGALQEKREDALIKQSQDEQYLQERQRNPGQIAPRLYGSIDAATPSWRSAPGKYASNPVPRKEKKKKNMKIGVT